MSHRYIEIEDGRWAVWSTVVDGWIATDLSKDDLVEWAGERARERAEERAEERIETIKNAESRPYYGNRPTDEEIEALRESEGQR
jgi:hypothetical protein